MVTVTNRTMFAWGRWFRACEPLLRGSCSPAGWAAAMEAVIYRPYRGVANIMTILGRQNKVVPPVPQDMPADGPLTDQETIDFYSGYSYKD